MRSGDLVNATLWWIAAFRQLALLVWMGFNKEIQTVSEE